MKNDRIRSRDSMTQRDLLFFLALVITSIIVMSIMSQLYAPHLPARIFLLFDDMR